MKIAKTAIPQYMGTKSNSFLLTFKGKNDQTMLIFDCDGTLINSFPHQKSSWQLISDTVAKDFNVQAKSIDEFYNHGYSGEKTLNLIISNLGLSDISEIAKLQYRKLKNQLYNRTLEEFALLNSPDSLLIKGTRNFLESIKKFYPELKMGVASNSVNAEPALKSAKLDHLFNKLSEPRTLIDGKDNGNFFLRSKPDPDIFLAMARFHHLPVENCVVFEDSIDGIRAAQSAQMRFVTIGGLEVPKNISNLGHFNNFSDINIKDLIKRISNVKK